MELYVPPGQVCTKLQFGFIVVYFGFIAVNSFRVDGRVHGFLNLSKIPTTIPQQKCNAVNLGT